MSIDIVFNELSAVPVAEDVYSARDRMTIFIGTLVRAQREKIIGSLRVPGTFYTILLAADYSLAKWTVDKQANQAERLFLLRRATQSPFVEDMPEAADEALLYSFTVDGQAAEGCGCAYLLDAVTISFQSAPQWNTSRLLIKIEHYNETQGIETETVEVVYACHADHFAEHHEWIEKRLSQSVVGGNELWHRREELFPSLLFCEQVERQMRTLEHGTPMLQPVIKHLFVLEAYCKSWTQGSFDPTQISANVSPESSVTLNQYSSARTFRCLDGSERVFNWHLKISLNAWRIYFDFDNTQPSTLLIGYIGKHLPTVNDPT